MQFNVPAAVKNRLILGIHATNAFPRVCSEYLETHSTDVCESCLTQPSWHKKKNSSERDQNKLEHTKKKKKRQPVDIRSAVLSTGTHGVNSQNSPRQV